MHGRWRSAVGLAAGLLIGAALGLVLFWGFPEDMEGLAPDPARSASDAGSEPIGPAIGLRAPNFELTDLYDRSHRLDEYRGQVVLLNFWATWCGPCLVEMPALQARFEALKTRGFVVLGINAGEGQEQVRAFAEELGLTFPVLLDPDEMVQRQYRVRGYPTSVFVDPEGVVRVVHVGLLSEGQLDQALAQMGLE